MGWRNTIVFRPLLGEQDFIDKFYSKGNPFRSENDEDYFYLYEYKSSTEELCYTVTKEYPGITFIGYTIYDTTCGDLFISQIMFNRQDGIIFYGPRYRKDYGGQKLLFDKNNNCIIRGIQNGDHIYNHETNKSEEVEPGSIWKETNTENAGYNIDIPEKYDRLDVTTEIKEFIDCIIEEYRMKIGITDKEYNILVENGLQHGYLGDGRIIRGDFRTELYAPDTSKLSRFQKTMIIKKTVSDLDWLLIKKLRETNNMMEIEEYANTIDVESIWEEHKNRFKNGKGTWERLKVDDLPF